MKGVVALLCVAAGCVMPRVVTVVEPYVAVIPIEQPESVTYIGGTRCDLQGHPYVLISPTLTPQQAAFVKVHEDIHVAQLHAFGGCVPYVARYERDSLFRLTMEGEAFCGVYVAQRKLKVAPDPDIDGIVWRLTNRYGSEYTRDAVFQAMPCG